MELKPSDALARFSTPQEEAPIIEAPVQPAPIVQPIVPIIERFKFDKEDLESAIIRLVKRNEPFIKKYQIHPGCTIEVKALRDEELGILNNTLQGIYSTGDKRTQKMHYTDPDDPTNQIVQESEVYVNADSIRAARKNEMAAWIYTINGEGKDYTFEQRQEMLEEFAPEFLNYVYAKIVSHFKALLQEAIKSLPNF